MNWCVFLAKNLIKKLDFVQNMELNSEFLIQSPVNAARERSENELETIKKTSIFYFARVDSAFYRANFYWNTYAIR